MTAEGCPEGRKCYLLLAYMCPFDALFKKLEFF
jgi:hypothetical protein